MYHLKLKSMPLPKVKLSAAVKGVELTSGWLLPMLFEMDSLLYGRWEYWLRAQFWGPDSIPTEPIPQIEWDNSQQVETMLTKCLDAIPNSSWQGWSGWDYFRYFLQWLLYGFGHQGQPELPKEPGGCGGASDRLYQLFQLGALQIFPDDYFGNLLAESAYGKRQGFYPTPMPVVQMMAQMTFLGGEKQDNRVARCGDPCCGTGRFPLVMSNYSLNIIAQDIDETLVMVTLVNAYLYAPWVARPLRWLGGDLLIGNSLLQDSTRSIFHVSNPKADTAINYPRSEKIERLEAISDTLTAQAAGNDKAVEYLDETEYDTDNKWTPIIKRRKKSKSNQEAEIIGYQGSLF